MTPLEDGTFSQGGGNADNTAKLLDLYFDRLHDFCFRMLGAPSASSPPRWTPLNRA